jgi:hypothetical protein
MLVREVLVGLGEPGRGPTLGEERDVVPTAQEPVLPVDHSDVHAGRSVAGDLVDESRELAGGRVVLAADGNAQCLLVRGLVGGHALAEQPQAVRVVMPFSPWLLPTMSLVNIPWTSASAFLSSFARNVEPNSPCSSPATAAKISVQSGRRVAITRASSIDTATPEASSSAPGAKL